ncbi:MAG: acetyltransferase [Candidatus Heimdallarchaeota archaeon]|nr:acetyltransferase [Candidatus Heimdallarchaeota archaeon]MCK4253968.1 acetyltransferase [Candidatus Heimdallarchaeota archaeon]
MVKKILIVGAGGQGKEVVFYINRINEKNLKYEIVGFLDDNKKIHGETINGIQVLGGIDWLDNVNSVDYVFNLALGKPTTKKKVFEKLSKYDVEYVSIIDPSVIIDETTIELGEGIIIAPGVVILPNVGISDHVLINYNAVIGHDCKIGKYCTVGPNAGIAGNVSIKEGAYIGIGANIIQNLTIGEWSTIGAGAAVVKNIPQKVVAVGVPAKPIK